MKKFLSIGLIALFITGCTNEEVAREVLHEARFHEVEITGYKLFSCPPADFIHTGFKAKNVFGESVTGVVCSSPFSDKPVIKY